MKITLANADDVVRFEVGQRVTFAQDESSAWVTILAPPDRPFTVDYVVTSVDRQDRMITLTRRRFWWRVLLWPALWLVWQVRMWRWRREVGVIP